MPFEYTPYFLPIIVSTLILFLLGIYSFRLRNKVEIAGLFALQNLAMGVWTLCYALELSSTTLEGKILWAKMKYLGSTTGPVLWFVFSLYYTNHKNWLTLPLKMLLGFFILFTVGVVFTNDLHHWYWTKIFLLPGFPETQSDHGFYFWVYAAGIYLLILASVIIYIIYYRTVPVYFRRQSILLVIGTFLPLGIRILEDFVGWDPFPKVDNIILFLLISALFYAVALFRYSALEIVPIAHSLVVQTINSGIIVLDVLGQVVELNPFVQKLLGAESRTFIGKPLAEMLTHGPAIKYSPQMLEQVEEEISFVRNGRSDYFIVQVAPIRDERKNLIGHVISLVDITERKYAEMELERLARTDMLTGVTNRRHFFELAEIEYQRFQRYKHPLTFMLMDIDHFKKINDQNGHLAGDHVLKYIATECRKLLRTSDIFARYGGEEFIALLVEVDHEGALETAERIRKHIEASVIEYNGRSIQLTMSAGLAFAQNDANLQLEKFIDFADKALYQSKASGRNKVTVWESK